MQLEEFGSLVKAVALNFGFKTDVEGGDVWLDILFNRASKYTEKEIKFGINEMFKITNEEWSKKYKVSYGKPPAVAVWESFFKLKTKRTYEIMQENKLQQAIEDARNGVSKSKTIEQKTNLISKGEIEKLIKTLGNRYDK